MSNEKAPNKALGNIQTVGDAEALQTSVRQYGINKEKYGQEETPSLFGNNDDISPKVSNAQIINFIQSAPEFVQISAARKEAKSYLTALVKAYR